MATKKTTKVPTKVRTSVTSTGARVSVRVPEYTVLHDGTKIYNRNYSQR